MATSLQLSKSYRHGPERLAAMLADEEFHRRKVKAIGGPDSRVLAFDTDPTSGRTTVTTRQSFGPQTVPSVVRRFLRGDLVIERTERWSLGPAQCRGEATVRVPGAPADGTASMTVRGSDGGSRLTVEITVRVAVPIVGGVIEGIAADKIRSSTEDEHRFIGEWLDGTSRATGHR